MDYSNSIVLFLFFFSIKPLTDEQPNQPEELQKDNIEYVSAGIPVKVDEKSHYIVTLPNEINPYKICRRCQEYISSDITSFKSNLMNLVDCGLSQYGKKDELNEEREIFSNDGYIFTIDNEKFLYFDMNSKKEFLSNFYAQKGRTVNGAMRARVIQMLMEENSYKPNFVIDQAVAIFDHFLVLTPNFAIDSLQLLGYVAYDIASKMDMYSEDIFYMSNSRLMWTQQELLDFELTVLDTLYFKTTYVTTYSFFTQLVNLSDILLPESFDSIIIFPYVCATLLSTELLNISVPILGTSLLLYCINHPYFSELGRDKDSFYNDALNTIFKMCRFYNISFNKLQEITETIGSFTQFLLEQGKIPNFRTI
ncbi:hypothetical protein EDI_130710 [Entamoeba dispar SAW760]|uniref:Cyclin N-terminal domain-containing protein n=1 Tax=Entamoeba dispar (strain ATCC PRA-260 / SAW760) TaxID=370354 RepID=B0E9I7_ENTDS|nr:uncharacterized protein EDI_130710 [Entamoeba dispar SAW760]EDR28794.1 hypothetical protein EDI_130710 [Entamoeba dispar SAW760]|eukprot:EDR28794.1 hypothetical protein EDI_130710 [Entamoeba dispar SAW760]